MATVQKTTLKRYNGTDWDPVYLANSADIVYLGKGFVVAADADGFTIGQNISANENMSELLGKVINHITTIDKTKLPGIVSGESITALAASKLTGVLTRAQLPTDVSGKIIEVNSEEEKDALTSDNVNPGDLVKVVGGKVYSVKSASETNVSYVELTDSASEIQWARLADTPTTLAGYGITDAVAANEKVTEGTVANAGKLLVLNADGKLAASVTGDAATVGGFAADHFATADNHTALAARVGTTETNITKLNEDLQKIDAGQIVSGTISIDRLPASVMERMYVIQNDEDLATLTIEQVQNGDTVKVNTSGLMYFVVDETKLGTEDYANAFQNYTAGAAAAVEWSGVKNHPTTVAGYGITDAVTNDKLSESVVKGKVPVYVEGTVGTDAYTLEGTAKAAVNAKKAEKATDADTLGTHAPEYFATKAEHDALAGTVGDNTKGLVKSLADVTTDVDTLKTDMDAAKAGTNITALAASKLTGTVARANLPGDVGGRIWLKTDLAAAKATLTAENCAVGDLVKLADGKVYFVTDTANLDNDNGYVAIVDATTLAIAWSQVTGTPTTLAGYGITDAVKNTDLVDVANAANAGKVLKVGTDGKLAASVTGDAATVGGKSADDFVGATEFTALSTTVGDSTKGLVKDVADLKTNIADLDASAITKGVISIDRLPHGALERCVVVATDAARKALTIDQVQTGDTVKVTETGMMYFVIDGTKLSEDAGYEVYTAGSASSVDWSGVQNRPTTLAGYGITDAVAATEKVTEAIAANAGKILVLNADGKLDVDITGKVAWANVDGAPTSTVEAIDAAVEAATHTNRTVLDKLTEAEGRLAYNGNAVAYKTELDTMGLGALKVVDTLPADATQGQLILEAVSASV